MPDTTALVVDDLADTPGDDAAADALAFRLLNEAWIHDLFRLEDEDRRQLGDPVGEIVARGGAVLIARLGGKAVGCVGLVPTRPGVVDLVKMAVSPFHQGRGIGRTLVGAAIERARALGAGRIELESNTRLAAAVHLYEQAGFRHLGPDEHPPSPYARADVAMALDLG